MKRSGVTRRLLVAGIATALAWGLFLPGCGEEQRAAKVVRVGFLNNDLHQLAYYVAREKGFFSREGLDVREGGAFAAGPEEMSAFSHGDLDVGYVGAAPAINFTAQDMASVEVMAQANTEGSAIVLRCGLEGSDVVALQGRTVAVPGYSTMQDMLLRKAIEEAGLKPGDVNIITLKPPEMIQALSSGQIDAFIAWEPYPSMAVEQGAGRVLESSSSIWPRHPCCVVVVDTGFLKKDPDAVRRFVAAHVEATEYIKNNRLEAIDMASVFTGQPAAVVKRAMKNMKYTYTPDEKRIQEFVEFLKDNGVIKVKNPAAFTRSFINTEFLPKEKS